MTWRKLWEYGWKKWTEQDEYQNPTVQLKRPTCARLSARGGLLIADSGNSRVIEVDTKGRQLWEKHNTALGENYKKPVYCAYVGDTSMVVIDRAHNAIFREKVGSRHCSEGTMLHTRSRPHYGSFADDGRCLVAHDKGLSIFDGADIKEIDLAYYDMRQPRMGQQTGNGCYLVSDNHGHKVVEFDRSGVLWQYGRTGSPGNEDGQLLFPFSVQRLANGHTLIADGGNQRVVEVCSRGNINWCYGITGQPGHDGGRLWYPQWAERLDDGRTVIASTFNDVVVVVDSKGSILSRVGSPKVGMCLLDNPRTAVPLLITELLKSTDMAD